MRLLERDEMTARAAARAPTAGDLAARARRPRGGHRRLPAALLRRLWRPRARPGTRSRRRRPAQPSWAGRHRARIDRTLGSRSTRRCCARPSRRSSCWLGLRRRVRAPASGLPPRQRAARASASRGSRSTPSRSPASRPSTRAGCSTTCSTRSRAARSSPAPCSIGSPPSSRSIPSASACGRSRAPSRTCSGATRAARRPTRPRARRRARLSVRASERPRLDRLGEVGPEILDVLESDGEPQQALRHAPSGSMRARRSISVSTPPRLVALRIRRTASSQRPAPRRRRARTPARRRRRPASGAGRARIPDGSGSPG